MTQTKVKICGLKTPQDVDAVVAAGADFCGLTFVPKSKRFISVAEAAELSQLAAPDLTRVALTVDADDALLDTIMGSVGIDMIQLHGHESPERVAAVKSRYNVPVLKAVGVADAADVAEIARYTPVTDWILLDAKPPKDAAVPGGNGLSFDWRLIADVTWQVPWMLAGGLTEDTVGEAIARTGAKVVDLASGVESAPGVKDAEKARRFVAAARA